ncbi:MAG TPA: SusC/RagA family TonB-linked outer membrane protein [Prevotella sp.]
MRKNTLLILMTIIGLLTAIPSLSQNKEKLSMKFNNEPLPAVLLQLEKKSNYKFLFTYDDVDKYMVNGNIANAAFFDVVDFVLKDTPLKYTIDGKTINIVLAHEQNKINSTAKEQTFTGHIYDAKTKEPIVGAQIRVIESSEMTISNMDGKFTIHLKKATGKEKILIAYLGMKTATVTLRNNQKIYLEADTKHIGEVVVTGIFKKAKESYTGSVTEINKDQIATYRSTNLMQTLRNLDASINFPINNMAGSNPNVLPKLNIRGSSSLPMNVEEFNSNAAQTVNAPLVIMDGFEISLSKLMDYNDEQIESINILKDAAATAIYGSRGANGVIVIITKSPQSGKLRVTAKAGISLEVPDLSSYHMLNAKEKLELEKSIGLYNNPYNPERNFILEGYYAETLKKVLSGTDTDWMSKPLRNGIGQRYNIQLDGGANEFRWGASLGYNSIEGVMKESSRHTLTGDITLLYSMKNLIFRNYTSIASNQSKNGKYGNFQNYVDMQPYNSPFDEKGTIVKDFYDLNHSPNKIGNPLYDATLNTIDQSEYFEFINNFSIEWAIWDGLRMRAKLGVSTRRSSSDLFLPAEHSTFNTPEYNTASGILRRGKYTYGVGTDNLYSGDITLSYTKTLQQKHQLYGGINYSISNEELKSHSFTAEGFTNDDLSNIGNALQYEQNSAPKSEKNIIRMIGLTGNANYTYDGRYYIDLSYRVDGSSKFGNDKRFAPFWSAGIGWNLHNEKWLYENKLFNYLRLKASYGVTGSQDFSTQSVYTTYKYISGSRYLNWASAQMMGLGNSALTWQKTNEFNIGMEFGLLKNRISGQVDLYTKKTSNLLSEMNLPLSMGFPSYIANIGELKNFGVEASLRAYIIRDQERRFNWMVGGQLVYNRNKISKLSNAIIEQNKQYLAQNVDVSNLFYVGRPMNAIYAVRSAGINPSSGEEVFYDKDGNVTGRWNASDKVYLGSSEPLYRGNFNTMVMWNNFTLNVSFGYHWGGKFYNQTLRNRVEVSLYDVAKKNVDYRVLASRWLHPGDVTFFKGFSFEDVHATSRYVFDDNVLTLQSVSLQYRWNTNWLKKHSGLESILFAINASDLAYWSSVKYERGTSYPYARNIQGTITLTF